MGDADFCLAEIKRPRAPERVDLIAIGVKGKRWLYAEYQAVLAEAEARFGLTEMEAECERLEAIEVELFDKLAATQATTAEGIALKLRAVQDWIDDDHAQAIVNSVLSDLGTLHRLA